MFWTIFTHSFVLIMAIVAIGVWLDTLIEKKRKNPSKNQEI